MDLRNGMTDNPEGSIKALDKKICPYLALLVDAESYAAYPSTINACYRGLHPVTPKISHQSNYCLTPNYPECSFFNNDHIKKFPKEIRQKSKVWSGKGKILIITALIFVALSLIILAVIFRGEFRGRSVGLVETSTQNISSLSTDVDTTVIPSGLRQKSAAAEVEKLPQSTATVLVTATPRLPSSTKSDPILALDTPIGGEQQFIIHRIIEGESLQYLADQYNTSIEEIIAVNQDLITPLWVGWAIVIPYNITNFEGLPAFSAYLVEEEGISIEELAEKLDVPLAALTLYNNIDEEHHLHQDEWLLIPGD